ncbi:MAG: glycogen/starch synthase [Ignavibacteriae bacterium]|nr:glycogen/starch synthase [Ignavibacteriota bacterium]
MPKSIGILFVASEADPFIKTGSIGDLAGTLPKSVKAMGHDIRLMLPGYGLINPRRFPIHNLLRMKDIAVPVGTGVEHAYVKSSYLSTENQKVLVYFLANDRYFNREGLYYHPMTKKYYTDNDERFIFFCRGVLETLKRLRWQPHIIHCNDWQCGLIPAYLKSIYKDDSYFKNVKTVFTVYSLASHATFPQSSYDKTGLPTGLFNNDSMNKDKLSFLNAGLTFADVITTFGNKAEKGIRVSPHDSLEKLLLARKSDIISMNHLPHNENSQQTLAQKLVDLYRDLVKNG